MRFAIEARVPYLDHRLVEAAMLLPDRLKIDRGITKAVLRRAARGAVPDVILNENRKIGFAAPQRSWLDSARPAISALFADSVAVRSGLADPDQLARLAKLRTSPHDDVSLWRAVSLELWLRGSAAIA
jgi:asparagine synthase (glutamine-hydrolysing)